MAKSVIQLKHFTNAFGVESRSCFDLTQIGIVLEGIRTLVDAPKLRKKLHKLRDLVQFPTIESRLGGRPRLIAAGSRF